MAAYLKTLLDRISLPLKAVIVGLLCGLTVWAVLDLIRANRLQAILTEQLTEHLQEEAAENRMLFDRYVKQHARIVGLLASHQPLIQTLQHMHTNEQESEVRHYHRERPPWFPPPSTWRGLIDPRHVLLRDHQGRIREIYNVRGGELPTAVYSDALLRSLSQNQAYLTRLDGQPCLLTSAPVADSQGRSWGQLTLIARLDDRFLTTLRYSPSETRPIMGLLDATKGHVLASNNPAWLAADTMLENLHPDYLVNSTPFFDYGASEMRLQLATFLPKDKVASINNAVVTLERRQHVVTAVTFIATFTILIFLLSRRINQLILRITQFAQETLGSKQVAPKWGDQLAFLDKRINLLMDEVAAARAGMRFRYEKEQKAKQLQVLEKVTIELGVGVLFLADEGEERVLNKQMSEFEAEYGKGWYSQEKSAAPVEVELKNARNEPRIFRVSYLSLFEPRDVIIARDVTERTRAQKILQESEERFRKITQSANDAIITIDVTGTIVSWNKAAMRIFGYSDTEALGSPLTRLIPAKDRKTHETGMDRFRAERRYRVTSETRELKGLHKNGHLFYLELSISNWTMEGTRYVTGILRDITQRKQAEEALRRERDFAESLIETAQTVVLVLDLEGRIVRFNRFLEQLCGYPLEEVRGRDWFSTFLSERHQEQSKELFTQSISDVPSHGTVNPIITRAGSVRYIQWYDKTLKDRHGDPVGLLAIGHDITQRKEQEAQLIQAQKLEVVGQLTDGIVHDFNNLLTIIMGNLRLLQEEANDEVYETIRELIEDALSAAYDGAEMGRRLLKFSRKQTVHPQPIDSNEFLNDSSRFIPRLLGEHITLRFIGTENIPMLFADSARLENAILNLIVNARDAMPEGGAITVEASRQHITSPDASEYAIFKPGTYIMISVSDTGIGMSADDTMRAIEPFYTTKEIGKGSGLGLSMVYDFSQQSGGGFRIRSKLGKGTSVSILLPEYDPNVHDDHEQAAPEALPRGSETILVVEDGVRLRKLAKRSLKSLGYQVREAENAAEALSMLSGDSTTDLLFSDIAMPGSMNGRGLATWALTNRPGLKILLTTGFDKDGSSKDLVNVGDIPLLEKPYTKEQLATKVRAVLDAERVVGSSAPC